MAYNKVILQGNLVRDIELKQTQSGNSVAVFTIAVGSRYKAKDGSTKEEVAFIDVESWGKQAEVIAEYFKRGSQILVDGRLKQDSWEKDGQKHTKIKVALESFSFVGSPKKDGDEKSGKQDDDEIPY